MTNLPRIGRFDVERELGSGSFATVWLATDPDLGVAVAIKLLDERWVSNDRVVALFVEEARALRVLPNEHVVEVHQIDRLPNGRPYMVMDYADAGNLRDRIRARAGAGADAEPFEPGEAVSLSVRIAEGLLAVHATGVVHRDLKPSNVLFQTVPKALQDATEAAGEPIGSERLLLTDFGISSRIGEGWDTGASAGTAHYIAPEQADPATRAASDQRADLYSAAVILYELLSLRVPFPLPTIERVLEAQRIQAPPSIRELRPELPDALIALVHRGLAKDPEWRFASAAEWLTALREAGAESRSGPSSAGPDRAPQPSP